MDDGMLPIVAVVLVLLLLYGAIVFFGFKGLASFGTQQSSSAIQCTACSSLPVNPSYSGGVILGATPAQFTQTQFFPNGAVIFNFILNGFGGQIAGTLTTTASAVAKGLQSVTGQPYSNVSSGQVTISSVLLNESVVQVYGASGIGVSTVNSTTYRFNVANPPGFVGGYCYSQQNSNNPSVTFGCASSYAIGGLPPQQLLNLAVQEQANCTNSAVITAAGQQATLFISGYRTSGYGLTGTNFTLTGTCAVPYVVPYGYVYQPNQSVQYYMQSQVTLANSTGTTALVIDSSRNISVSTPQLLVQQVGSVCAVPCQQYISSPYLFIYANNLRLSQKGIPISSYEGGALKSYTLSSIPSMWYSQCPGPVVGIAQIGTSASCFFGKITSYDSGVGSNTTSPQGLAGYIGSWNNSIAWVVPSVVNGAIANGQRIWYAPILQIITPLSSWAYVFPQFTGSIINVQPNPIIVRSGTVANGNATIQSTSSGSSSGTLVATCTGIPVQNVGTFSIGGNSQTTVGFQVTGLSNTGIQTSTINCALVAKSYNGGASTAPFSFSISLYPNCGPGQYNITNCKTSTTTIPGTQCPVTGSYFNATLGKCVCAAGLVANYTQTGTLNACLPPPPPWLQIIIVALVIVAVAFMLKKE